MKSSSLIRKKNTPDANIILKSENLTKELLIGQIEEEPLELLKKAVLIDDTPIRNAIADYHPQNIKVFTKNIFYRTLLVAWLKESKTQVQRTFSSKMLGYWQMTILRIVLQH